MSTARRPLARTGVVAAVVVLGAVTACGSSGPKTAGSSAAVGSVGSTPPAADAGTSAAARTALVVYSAQGYDGPVTKAFTKATGIPVKLVDDSTGPLLTKVAAEKNNPQWGLLWVDGDTAFAALDKQGQLLPYTATTALNAAGQALVPADHSYVPVSTTVMAALIYNAAKAPAVPRSYQELLDPRYRALVGMNDPSQSGPTFPFVAGLMNQLGGQAGGVAAGKAYLNKLKANGLHVFPTNGDTLHALETGQISYGLIQSSAATGEVVKVKKSAAFEPKVVYLPTTTLLPGVIGIDKAAPAAVQDEAKKFVEYVLSPAGQQAMLTGDASGDSLYWPVVDSVQANSALGAIPAHQKINPYFWGPQEADINTFFDRAIK
jgi:iron(III) transport system substrate-binding protein